MQYTATRGEKGTIEIKVDVPKAAFNESYDFVLNQLGKDVKVSGFRPGNVPKDVLERHIGISKILNETASFLISKHLGDILKKEEIVPIANPSVAVETLSADSPFTFMVTLTQKPKIVVSDWKNLKLKKMVVKDITDEDINKSIVNIHEAWKKSSSATSDAKAMDVKKATEGRAEMDGVDETGPSFAEATKGKKFIYDAQGEKVYLDKSEELKRSEDNIDDEFARKIGARDLLHLKELVKKDLETLVAGQVEAKLEEEIFDEIVKIAEVEVPDLLVDDEINRILVRLNQQLEQQGKKLEGFLKEEKTTVDELRTKWRPQAEKNVKVTLIMDEIGKAEKLEVTREEIENAAKGVNQENLSPDQKADLERYLTVSIFQAKALDLVKKTVTA